MYIHIHEWLFLPDTNSQTFAMGLELHTLEAVAPLRVRGVVGRVGEDQATEKNGLGV